MTKFKNYIIAEEPDFTELLDVKDEMITEEISKGVKKIKQKCKPWLNTIKSCKNKALWRGVTSTGGDPVIMKPVRTDRQPLMTGPKDQKKFDTVFDNYWGWKPRATGLFATGDYATAAGFGENTYLIFPVGPFKYLWAEKIDDLWNYRKANYDELRQIVKTEYSDKDICKALSNKSGIEIMIKTKSYIGIYDETLNDFLLKTHNKNLHSLTANFFINEYLY